MVMNNIRNFCIIAHIDHGKSTLADRLLEFTKTIPPHKMREQVLDRMDLERERGITIKLTSVRMEHNGYILNLIDTPGHVDFSYEVSRSLAACEGALLLVDASQGVEAQTQAHGDLAREQNLTIIPVINKIDLKNADIERTKKEIREVMNISGEIILASGKEGQGIEEIIKAIIEKVPSPRGSQNSSLRCLVFDSYYDTYRGVVVYVRVVDGEVRPEDKVKFFATGKVYEVVEVGVFKPDMTKTDMLSAGEVGYIIANIKSADEAQPGDTIISFIHPSSSPLKGYKKMKPMVYCSFYPTSGENLEELLDALSKLKLNDSALMYEAETSAALGLGVRCGFLGLLHMEIVQERLEREYSLNLIATAPSVVYKVETIKGEVFYIDNPSKFPSPDITRALQEPYIKAKILLPQEYLGQIMELGKEKRGVLISLDYFSQNKVLLIYEMPLAEIILEFFDQLKSRSQGYASLDYEMIGYKTSNLVKLEILIAGEVVDALSIIIHKDKAYYHGRKLVEKLKKTIPRHLFEIALQARIQGKIIARENISAMRKDVLAKCYGGDVTRKRKLLEKQKEGKKRMKQIGRVEIPQDAFLSVLKTLE